MLAVGDQSSDGLVTVWDAINWERRQTFKVGGGRGWGGSGGRPSRWGGVGMGGQRRQTFKLRGVEAGRGEGFFMSLKNTIVLNVHVHVHAPGL